MTKQDEYPIIEIGNYTAVHCESLVTHKTWWRVYPKDTVPSLLGIAGLSDHAHLVDAKRAMLRYQKRDENDQR